LLAAFACRRWRGGFASWLLAGSGSLDLVCGKGACNHIGKEDLAVTFKIDWKLSSQLGKMLQGHGFRKPQNLKDGNPDRMPQN